MPSQSLKSKQALHKQLSDQAREGKESLTVYIPSKYARYSPEELFKQFKLAKMTHYGDVAAAYGEYGISGGITVGVDIAAILSASGFPAYGFMSMTVSGGGNIEVLKETMVVLHQVGPTTSVRRKLAFGGRDYRRTDVWKTNKPVALMPFSGKQVKYTGTIAFDLTTQMIPLAGVEGYTMAPDVKGGNFNVTLNISRQNIAWTTPSPRWYPGYADPNIGRDFQNFLGSPAKVQVKEEIIEWLQHIRSIINRLQSDHLVELKKQLKNLPKRRFHRAAHSLPRLSNTSTSDFVKKLDNILDELDNVMNIPVQGEDVGIMKAMQSRTEVRKQVQWFKASLQKARAEEVADETIKSNMTADGIPRIYFRDSAEWKSYSDADKKTYESLCFARLSLWNPEISATIGLALKPEAVKKNEDGSAGPFGTEIITLNPLDLSAGYAVKYATSRYQSFAVSKRRHRPLVFTQDVYLRYSRFWFSAAIMAKMDNFKAFYPAKAEESKGKSVLSKMRYNAVSAFWIKHNSSDYVASLRKGSGLSYGTHISPGLLYKFSTRVNDPQKKEQSWLKAKYYASRIHMNRGQFKKFLLAFKAQVDADAAGWQNVVDNYPQVLIESAYRLTKYNISVKKGELSDLLKKFEIQLLEGVDLSRSRHQAAPFTLESVRVRIRMDDHRNAPHTSFKLGLVTGPVTIAVDFKKVTRSGNQGIWEYLYYAAENHPPHTVIPPVFLLPHTFQ